MAQWSWTCKMRAGSKLDGEVSACGLRAPGSPRGAALLLAFVLMLVVCWVPRAQAQTYTNNTAGNIQFNNCLARTFTVPALAVLDLNVAIDITHTWRGDLVLTLSSPDGVTRTLFNRHGDSADNLIAIFDDSANQSITSDVSQHNGSATRYRRATETLLPFNGLRPAGVWTLQVCDLAPQDQGTFNSASLLFVSVPSITIIKDAVPDSPQDFSFQTVGAGLTPFLLDDDSDDTLPRQQGFGSLTPGIYVVTEAITPGWALSNIVCVDPDGGTSIDVAARSATIDLDPGENIVCTFTNTLASADLRLTKTNTPGLNGEQDQAGDTVVSGTLVQYVLTIDNLGPDAADGASVSDPPGSGLTCTNVVCAASNGATCPLETGGALLAALQSGSAIIPALPANGRVVFTISCLID